MEWSKRRWTVEGSSETARLHLLHVKMVCLTKNWENKCMWWLKPNKSVILLIHSIFNSVLLLQNIIATPTYIHLLALCCWASWSRGLSGADPELYPDLHGWARCVDDINWIHCSWQYLLMCHSPRFTICIPNFGWNTGILKRCWIALQLEGSSRIAFLLVGHLFLGLESWSVVPCYCHRPLWEH